MMLYSSHHRAENRPVVLYMFTANNTNTLFSQSMLQYNNAIDNVCD